MIYLNNYLLIGLTLYPNDSCLFHGIIGPNKVTTYVGLYVDNFFYFGTKNVSESLFEQEL